MRKLTKGIVAVFALLAAAIFTASSAQAIYTPYYYVSHNGGIQDIQGICHTSGAHSGISLEYCLYVGVQNQYGSQSSANYFDYYVSLWCKDSSGTVVHCSGARVNFTVVAYNLNGTDKTVYDTLQCGSYGGSFCPSSSHLATGWSGTGATLNVPSGTGTWCTSSPYLKNGSSSAYVNGFGVATTTTDSWIVCDNT